MNSNRKNISSNSPWEDIVGYSRAVRVGNQIFVSGTTATDSDGKIVGINDPYIQTNKCIENIGTALKKADASLTDITRLRIFTTNIEYWETIGKALSKHFIKIKPAATMVEISKLIDPNIIVEIEADAFVQK